MQREGGWALDSKRATLSGDGWQATVDVSQPSRGIEWSTNKSSAYQLLSVSLPEGDALNQLPLVNHYRRGQDLVANFEQESPRHLRPQIYWRAQPKDNASDPHDGILLQVSLQTNRLDAYPALTLESKLPAGELRSCGASDRFVDGVSDGSLILYRPKGNEAAIVIAHHPADVSSQEAEGSEETGWTLRAQLLGEHLEKGVIRRCQSAIWQVPADGAEVSALKHFEAFLAAPPPLTV